MKLLVACEDTGSLKEIICSKGTDTSKADGPQPTSVANYCEENESKKTKILQMIEHNNNIYATRLDGSICIYSLEKNYDLIHRYTDLTEATFVSLFKDSNFNRIYAATCKGEIIILDFKKTKDFNVVHPIKLNLPIGAKDNVCAFVSHPIVENIFACGGKETDLKVLKLDKSRDKFEILFSAKNVSNDHLDLRQPIWITRIGFLPDHATDIFRLVTATRYGQVRLYDSSKSRKPVISNKLSLNPLVTLITLDSNEIIASDTKTTTAKWNLNTGELIGKYQGAVGSVQTLKIFNETGILSTGGLDRYVRCFNVNSRECIVKVFVGTQINEVLILDDEEGIEGLRVRDEREKLKEEKERKEKLKQEGIEEESDEEEEMWSKLENNLTERRKRRKLELK